MIWFLGVLVFCSAGLIAALSYFVSQKNKESTDNTTDDNLNRMEKELYNLLIYDGTERGQVNLIDE